MEMDKKNCRNITLKKSKKGSEKKNGYGRNHKREYQEKTTDSCKKNER